MPGETSPIEHEWMLQQHRKRKKMLLLPFLVNFILTSVWLGVHGSLWGPVVFFPACMWLYALPWVVVSGELAVFLGGFFGIGLYATLFGLGVNAEKHRHYVWTLRALSILISLNVLTLIIVTEWFDFILRGLR